MVYIPADGRPPVERISTAFPVPNQTSGVVRNADVGLSPENIGPKMNVLAQMLAPTTVGQNQMQGLAKFIGHLLMHTTGGEATLSDRERREVRWPTIGSHSCCIN